MNAVGLFFISIYLLKIIFEKKRLYKNRKKIKILIHVNGVRGKSTVSRLIDAGLRDGKRKIFTKVTGTSPKYIDIYGNEKELKRKGKANIREQIEIINKAANLGAEIVILECMAVKSEFQKVCEEKILKSDISIITNVREDHLDEMGRDLNEIAKSLGQTISSNGSFITGDKKYFKYFKKIANSKNTKASLITFTKKEYEKIDFPENVTLAIEVCRILGINEKEALFKMKEYKKDIGILREINFKNKWGKKICFLNLMAANDPDSTKNILEMYKKKSIWNQERYLMINNRRDRLTRLIQFVKFAKENEKYFNKILISGESKRLFYKKLKVLEKKLDFIENIKYLDNLKEDSLIIAAGNICGKGMAILKEIEKREEGRNE